MSGETIQVYTKQSVDALFASLANQMPDALARGTVTANSGALASQDTAALTVALGRAFLLFSVSTSVPARVRVYSSSEARAVDLSRLASAYPTGEHGLIFEGITTTDNLTITLAPIAVGNGSESGAAFISLTNLTNTNQPISISFSRLPLEV